MASSSSASSGPSSPSLSAASTLASSTSSISTVPFTQETIALANESLATSSPQQILQWASTNLPSLFQTTALGITGLAATDMLQKIHKRSKGQGQVVGMIFIDTLYHFEETLELLERVEKKYGVKVNVFKPEGTETVKEFEEKHGEELWKTDEESYDYLVKVEPARRAYAELGVKAVITGRRQSQGADRASLQPLEMDSTGLIKVNPLCRWGFQEVKDYIEMAGVPSNVLLERGYKSVGDWHSTKVPVEGEGEREGRWSGNKEKTECGLHKDYFKMKKAFEKKTREAEMAKVDALRDEDVGISSVNFGALTL